MNIAFSALVILFVVLPGIVFRYWYRKGSWESPVIFASAAEEVAYGLFFAVVLHVAALSVAGLFGAEPDLEAAFYLMMGRAPSDAALEAAVGAVTGHLGEVVAYFLLLNIAALLLGRGLHETVRATHLDKTTRLFQFDNKWYYLLSGEMEAIQRCDPSSGAAPSLRELDRLLDRKTMVLVSVVVDEGGVPYLYWGVLFRFYFDRRGRLSELVFQLAFRRELQADGPTEASAPGAAPSRPGLPPRADDPRYYHIKGDYLTVRFEHVKTINVDYLHFYEKE